jgi:hypothetical protein
MGWALSKGDKIRVVWHSEGDQTIDLTVTGDLDDHGFFCATNSVGKTCLVNKKNIDMIIILEDAKLV